MARSPLPIVSPSTPTSGASRTSTAASGSFPASGLSTGATLGPWMIEEQSMEIQYWRVPKAYQKSFDASLSGVSHTTTFQGTTLAWIATLNYSKKKSYESFDASSWHQTQLLDVLAVSADLNGTTYGDITASTLGPLGRVITTRPYYRRGLWDDAVDATSVETAYASNFVLATGGASGMPYVTGPEDVQDSLVGRQDLFALKPAEPGYPFAHKPAQHIPVGGQSNNYHLPGTYSTDQETLYNIIAWIDGVAQTITGYKNYFTQEWQGAYSIPATVNSAYPGPYQVAFLMDSFCASYDVTHHDWS